MQRYKRIELALNWKMDFSWEIARGVRDASLNFHWELFSSPRESFTSILEWEVDGVIVLGLIEPDQIELAQKSCRVPLVNISPAPATPGIPQVDGDLRAGGALAAEHLFSKGFLNGFWLGNKNQGSLERGYGFEEKMKTLGGSAEILMDTKEFYGLHHDEAIQYLTHALRIIEKPTALYCVDDHLARFVTRVCRDEKITIPNDIAVMGTENSDFICNGVHPYLTSVDVGYHRIGFRAAQVLHRLMNGQTVPECTLLPPVEVIQRESTDVMAIPDDRLRTVMDYLRNHYMEKVDLTQLAASVGLSRRGLEYLFRNVLQRSPHEEILSLRFRQVKTLLRTTQMVIDEIAVATGFNSGHYLSDMFKRHIGQTPSAYRKNHFIG